MFYFKREKVDYNSNNNNTNNYNNNNNNSKLTSTEHLLGIWHCAKHFTSLKEKKSSWQSCEVDIINVSILFFIFIFLATRLVGP